MMKMKKGLLKISQKQLSLIGVAIITLLTIFKSGLFTYSPERYPGITSYTIVPTPIDSLDTRMREAQQQADRLKWDKERFMSGFQVHHSFTFSSFGVAELSFLPPYQAKSGYYLSLPCLGFRQENYPYQSPVDYMLKEGQPLLIRQEMKKIKDENTLTSTFTKVDYYYSGRENMLFISFHSTSWRLVTYFFGFVVILLMVALYLFALFTFFNFILAVAKNEVFNEANIRRLKDLSISLLVIGLFSHLLNLFIYIVFSATHRAEGIIITHSLSAFEYLSIVFAILSYLMYTAFKKAFILQNENDLTI